MRDAWSDQQEHAMTQSNAVPLRGEGSVGEVAAAFDRLKEGYRAEPFPTADVREDRLERIIRMLQRERQAFIEAIAADFGSRAPNETLSADILATLDRARDARKHVRQWMQRKATEPQWYMRPAKTYV